MKLPAAARGLDLLSDARHLIVAHSDKAVRVYRMTEEEKKKQVLKKLASWLSALLESADNIVDDFAVIPFEPLSTRIIQAGRVESHLMQYRRMQVGHVMPIFDCMETKFVRSAVNMTTFDATSCHRDTESMRVVIAARTGNGPYCFSRYSAPGVRPNSEPMTTIVSSSRPRSFRSLMRTGNRLIHFFSKL